MARLRLHKRNIFSGDVKVLGDDEVTIVESKGRCAICIFADEPERRRWFVVSQGPGDRVDCSRFHEWWVNYVEDS